MVKKIKNKNSFKRSRKKNKNGVPVLDGGEDFLSLFKKSLPDLKNRQLTEEKITSKETTEKSFSKTEKQSAVNKKKICFGKNIKHSHAGVKNQDLKKDKHGIQILNSSENFTEIFQQKSEGDNFPDLLDLSLKGKNMQTMMIEKRDKTVPALVPLKKRLKRYPPPQKILDLHGDTASTAELKAETYIRTCRRNGIFTLRIVVGRGLHSKWGPVLPDIIEDLLIKLKKQDIVLWFNWDRKKKSRSGSLIVYLKQFRN